MAFSEYNFDNNEHKLATHTCAVVVPTSIDHLPLVNGQPWIYFYLKQLLASKVVKMLIQR